MNESINKPILLKCPKCGHSWNYKGKAKRAQCGSCRYKGIITYIKTTPTTPSTTPTISSDFMSGSLIDALKKTGLDPMKNGQISSTNNSTKHFINSRWYC